MMQCCKSTVQENDNYIRKRRMLQDSKCSGSYNILITREKKVIFEGIAVPRDSC